jgi:hypothetical protein
MKLAGVLCISGLVFWAAAANRLNAAPGTAVLVGVGGAVLAGSPMVFSWNAVAGATWYYLWVNDQTGTRHTVWYTAAQVGCASGESVCSVTVGAALKVGPAYWWIRTWDPSGYGPWSPAGRFSVVSPAEGGLRIVDLNGTTVGTMVDETKVVRPINGRLAIVRASAGGFFFEGVSLDYTSTDCSGQAYTRVDLLPYLTLAGSFSNGYLAGSDVASRLHQSSKSISESGVVGSCSSTNSTFNSVRIDPYNAASELGGLLPPFSVVQ